MHKKTQDFIPALKYVLQYSEHYPFTLLFPRSLISDCLFGDSDNIPGNHGICLRRFGTSHFGDSDNILVNRHYVINSWSGREFIGFSPSGRTVFNYDISEFGVHEHLFTGYPQCFGFGKSCCIITDILCSSAAGCGNLYGPCGQLALCVGKSGLLFAEFTALVTEGTIIATRIPMITITTINSTRVKPFFPNLFTGKISSFNYCDTEKIMVFPRPYQRKRSYGFPQKARTKSISNKCRLFS